MSFNIKNEDSLRIKKLLSEVLGVQTYAKAERMGGLTNRTYQVTLENQKIYVVRLPGEGTEELINRADEKISTLLACKLGIDAQLLYFSESGEKVTVYIDGAQTMSADSIGQTDNLKKAAALLRRLHACGENTGVPFDVFHMAASYERIIASNHVALFDDYDVIKSQVMAIRQELGSSGVDIVPCHNDPLCENWVLDGEGYMYLIDWEYAGMNDAMWDLADVSIEAALSAEQDHILLSAYFGRKATGEEHRRFHANKLYLDYLWTLWGKARVPFDGETMEEYAAERYARLKKNLAAFVKTVDRNR